MQIKLSACYNGQMQRALLLLAFVGCGSSHRGSASVVVDACVAYVQACADLGRALRAVSGDLDLAMKTIV